jgi:hypothetical protein
MTVVMGSRFQPPLFPSPHGHVTPQNHLLGPVCLSTWLEDQSLLLHDELNHRKPAPIRTFESDFVVPLAWSISVQRENGKLCAEEERSQQTPGTSVTPARSPHTKHNTPPELRDLLTLGKTFRFQNCLVHRTQCPRNPHLHSGFILWLPDNDHGVFHCSGLAVPL